VIPQSPAEIVAVLTDPRGHVAIDSSGMLTRHDRVPAVGAPLSSTDREALNDLPLGLFDVTITIVKLESDREIAWTVEGGCRL
jgi:hypothetical protein